MMDCGWQISFRRALTEGEHVIWHQLKEELAGVTLSADQGDDVKWALKSRKYTTQSMYRSIIDDGVHNRQSSLIWKCRVPIKIKVFNYVASS